MKNLIEEMKNIEVPEELDITAYDIAQLMQHTNKDTLFDIIVTAYKYGYTVGKQGSRID